MRIWRRWWFRLFWVAAGVYGLGALILAHSQWFFDGRVLEVSAPETAEEGEWVPVAVRVYHRRSGKPWTGAPLSVSAGLASASPVQSKEARPGRVALDADGRATLEVRAEFSRDVGQCFYQVLLADGAGEALGMQYGVVRRAGNAFGASPPPVHIVTDKPVYQPGQRLHFAAFVLTPEGLLPRVGENVAMEIFDGRGNRVWRREAVTSAHGIVSDALPLSEDPNPGAWQVVVTTGKERVEKTVTVKRYVRRRLDAKVSFDPPYLAGDPETGGATARVAVTYFNGRPAAEIKVTLKAAAGTASPTTTAATVRALAGDGDTGNRFHFLDAEGVRADELVAVTDRDGVARFPVRIAFDPDDDARVRPGRLALEAVLDDGGTPERWDGEIPYHPQPLRLALLPANTASDGKTQAFLLSAWLPDGRPKPGVYAVEVGMCRPRRLAVVVDGGGVGAFSVETGKMPMTVRAGPAPDAPPDAKTGDPLPPRAPVVASSSAGRAAGERRAGIPEAAAEFHWLPEVGMRLLADSPNGPDGAPGFWRAGAALSGDILIPPERGDAASVRVTLATPGGAMAPAKATKTAAGRWRFTGTIPAESTGGVLVLAQAGFAGRPSLYGRLALPLAAADGDLSVVPDKPELGPRETAVLSLALPARAAKGGGDVAGAACVVVADAAILARGGGVTPEAEALAFLRERSMRIDLPPPVTQALETGTLPFALSMSRSAPFVVADNLPSLAARDHRRYAGWVTIFGAVLSSLLVAWLFWRGIYWLNRLFPEPPAKAPPDHSTRLIELLVVVAIIAILAGMLMPALQRSREAARMFGSPLSSEEAEAVGRRLSADAPSAKRASTGVPEVMARDWFPETLAFLPEVPLDARGGAEVPVTVADNLTHWRASAVAVAGGGGLYAGGADILCTRPFFIEPDFPVAFVAGDEPELRLAVFSRDAAPSVEVTVAPSEFFVCDEPKRTVAVAADGRAWVTFRPRFTKPGVATLDVAATAKNGDPLQADRIQWPVTVAANGREAAAHHSGVIRDGQAAVATLSLPAEAIRETYTLRAYGAPLAEYLAGVESLLRIPTGCFEQTSSANYPNLLILEYLRASGKADPKVEARALDYLRKGYQRLLTFEVAGGGFSLYGHAPADPWLTAYGLMQFHDLSKAIDVDPMVMTRTWAYLAAHPALHGNFAHGRDIAGGLDNARAVAAYAAWAAAELGKTPPPAWREPLAAMVDGVNPYERLLAANALLAADPGNERAKAALRAVGETLGRDLPESRTPQGMTLSHARGAGLETEWLALTLIGGARGGLAADGRLVERLAALRQAGGGWPGTHATVLALKALINNTANDECDGELTVMSEGVTLARLRVDAHPGGAETAFPRPPTDRIELRYAGKGRVSYTLAAKGELRWSDDEADLGRAGLRIGAKLTPAELRIGDEATLEVRIAQPGDRAENPLVEVGLGAGFEANPAQLDALVADPAAGVRRHESRGRTVVLYLARLGGGDTRAIPLKLSAARAGRLALPPVKVWEYYRPENAAEAAGPVATVKGE